MTYEKINNQQEINSIFEKFYWEDAFIREVYVLNPSHFTDDKSQYAPDALPNIGMVLLTYGEYPQGLELVFYDVESMNLNFDRKLNLKCQLVYTKTMLGPKKMILKTSDDQELVIAREMRYRILPKEETIGDRIKSSDYWLFNLTEN